MPGAFSSKRHFLFDLDGTLIDSAGPHERAYREALQASHPQLAKSFDYARFAGQPTRQVFSALGIAGEAELADLTSRKQQLYREALVRGEVSVFPGVEELLAQLRGQDRHLYLVTGSSGESVRRLMEQKQLSKFFMGAITVEDAPRGKPAPEPYLTALTRFSLAREECLAIEDGKSGIESAQAAGLDVVLIHTEDKYPGILNIGNCEQFAALLRT